MKKYINIWTSTSLALMVAFIGFLVYQNSNSDTVSTESPDTLYEEESRTNPKRSATIEKIEITDVENVQNLLDSLAQVYPTTPQ